jgi:drug/metabolite transporter (DMT)-like permease
MRIGLNEIPIFTYRTAAVLLSASTAFALALARGASLRIPRDVLVPLIVAGLLFQGALAYFTYLALTLISSGHAVIIGYTMPLWVVLLSILFLGERPTALRWFGLALGMTGIGLLAGRGIELFVDAPLGIAAQLLGAIAWAIAVIITKKVRWHMPMDVVLGWQCLFGGIPLAFIAIPELSQLKPVSWMAICSVFYLGICAQGLGNCMWFRIISMVLAGIAGVSSLTVPAVGLLAGALLLHETIGVVEITALFLVLGALLTVVTLPSFRHRPNRSSKTAT